MMKKSIFFFIASGFLLTSCVQRVVPKEDLRQVKADSIALLYEEQFETMLQHVSTLDGALYESDTLSDMQIGMIKQNSMARMADEFCCQHPEITSETERLDFTTAQTSFWMVIDGRKTMLRSICY